LGKANQQCFRGVPLAKKVVPMQRRGLAAILAACLLGLMPTQSADAVAHRRWGQALDSYGAKLFVCRLPERSKLGTPGTLWRYYLRAVNHSRVRVVVSARVKRWIFAQDRTVTKKSWVRSLPIGGRTAVGSVPVYDQHASSGRFADYISFRVRRPFDGKAIEWETMYPTGAPRCSLAAGVIAWQSSGFVNNTDGRLQLCSNKFLDARGPTTRWRFRGDATRATRPFNYQAKVARVSDGLVSGSWSQTIPPGGYTQRSSLTQPLEIDPATNSWANGFTIAVSEAGTTDTGYGSGIGPKNIC
jgi:hypothetical protein